MRATSEAVRLYILPRSCNSSDFGRTIELFECFRKILLVGMPVFFEMGSVAQLSYGLLVCFMSFGAYMLLSPYANDSDDRLSQLCQMQILGSRSALRG